MTFFYGLVAVSAGAVWIVVSPFGWVVSLILTPLVSTAGVILAAAVRVVMSDRKAARRPR